MKNIIIDVRLLSKGGSSGIEEYTGSLVSNILEIDKTNRYILFYNGFRKVPLPGNWNKNARIVSRNIPNKLFDASSMFLKWPKVESFDPGVGGILTSGSKDSLVFSPHFNILETNLPHIITFHDLSFLHHPDFFSIKQKFWHWMQDYKKKAERAKAIIAVSEFTKSDLVNFLKIPEEKVKVIYSGVDPGFKKLPPNDVELLSAKEKFNLEKPFILYLGTIEPRKNLPAIIRAFNLLKTNPNFKEFQLVIAGAIGWLSSGTLFEIESSKYRDDIRLLGSISPEERVFIYNLASVFVYPSFFEGFGFPPLEAQRCGVPVVASNRTSLPEILGESAMLIDPWKTRDLANAIEEVLSGTEAREELVRKGYENVKRFSWEGAARETIRVFEDIIE